jgi:hypothetical protein
MIAMRSPVPIPRMTKFYDRRQREVTRDISERITI